MDAYGMHRVLDPPGGKNALKLDNSPVLMNEHETLIDVAFLNLDSTSMKQLRESSGGDENKIRSRILQIVNEDRGKMHNPVTNSGGVLLGRIAQMGSALKQKYPSIHVGTEVIPLASLSCLPLRLASIGKIDGDQVAVTGTAVLNGLIVPVAVPAAMSPTMVLSAIDVSRAVPLLKREMDTLAARQPQEKTTVLVVGTGKAGITCLAALRYWYPKVRALAIDVSDRLLAEARNVAPTNSVIEKVDAQNVGKVLEFVTKNTEEGGADLVLSCVNAQYVEASCIVGAKHKGAVMFFSMATQFDRACLSTDGVAKDVVLLMGGGVDARQADLMFELLRADSDLWHFLASY